MSVVLIVIGAWVGASVLLFFTLWLGVTLQDREAKKRKIFRQINGDHYKDPPGRLLVRGR
jgi:hypothetical protein